MEFRHEWKHEITRADQLALRARLRAVMAPDPHAVEGRYQIRSVYFDDPWDTALREKIDGVNRREKFRIRWYNADTTAIFLEKKSKINGLCSKEQARLSLEQVRALAAGRPEALAGDPQPLVGEFRRKLRTRGLRPKTVVDYTRDAFVFAPGNVRVTLDYDIRTAVFCADFLNAQCLTVPARYAPIILEVKWDAFLPNVIRDIVQVPTIDIVMDDWEGFLETCTDEQYVLCDLVIDGEAYNSVAIRAKGNTSLSQVASYGNDRYSFKVEFDHYDSTSPHPRRRGAHRASAYAAITEHSLGTQRPKAPLEGSWREAPERCSRSGAQRRRD